MYQTKVQGTLVKRLQHICVQLGITGPTDKSHQDDPDKRTKAEESFWSGWKAEMKWLKRMAGSGGGRAVGHWQRLKL